MCVSVGVCFMFACELLFCACTRMVHMQVATISRSLEMSLFHQGGTLAHTQHTHRTYKLYTHVFCLSTIPHPLVQTCTLGENNIIVMGGNSEVMVKRLRKLEDELRLLLRFALCTRCAQTITLTSTKNWTVSRFSELSLYPCMCVKCNCTCMCWVYAYVYIIYIYLWFMFEMCAYMTMRSKQSRFIWTVTLQDGIF